MNPSHVQPQLNNIGVIKRLENTSLFIKLFCSDNQEKYLIALILKVKKVQFPILACVSDRQGFQVGSLSHMINLKAGGYQELPEFPEAAPDPSVRDVEVSLLPNTFKNFVISSRSSSWSYLCCMSDPMNVNSLCSLQLVM